MVDAFYYQEKYGGDISIITETQWNRYFDDFNDDDDDDDDYCLIERDDKGNYIENIENENDNDIPEKIDECKHYVLNISDTKTLSTGYRFIKELILQHHNFDMNEAYETL